MQTRKERKEMRAFLGVFAKIDSSSPNEETLRIYIKKTSEIFVDNVRIENLKDTEQLIQSERS